MNIRWSRHARADLYAIAEHYAEIDPDLADLILTRLADAAQPLRDHPKAGPVTQFGMRKWRARDTPYVLIYRVLPDRVEIARVRHGASDWAGRF